MRLTANAALPWVVGLTYVMWPVTSAVGWLTRHVVSLLGSKDGGPAVTTTATVAANGSTTLLIPGMTVNVGALLQALHSPASHPSEQAVGRSFLQPSTPTTHRSW